MSSTFVDEEADVELAGANKRAADDTPKKTHNINRRVVVTVSAVVLVGAILTGLLVAKPWANTDTQEQVSFSGAADHGCDDASSSAVVATATGTWPHEASDIEADPDVKYGSLENGFRYIIMENSEPPNKLMLRMHIDAGAYQEETDQRGIAHFLEHMAFNGLKNFDSDALLPQLQRAGIAFGAHANAYTALDETVYMLDLPNATDSSLLDLGFSVMRDQADGILLEEEEIEKERGKK